MLVESDEPNTESYERVEQGWLDYELYKKLDLILRQFQVSKVHWKFWTVLNRCILETDQNFLT